MIHDLRGTNKFIKRKFEQKVYIKIMIEYESSVVDKHLR